MTYRITTFLMGLLVLGGFALFPVSASAAAPIEVHIKKGEEAPTCKARASKKSVYSGQQFTISWSSKYADKMLGITKGGEWKADGKQKIAVGFEGKTVFPMAFVGDGGVALCNVTVHVHKAKDKKD